MPGDLEEEEAKSILKKKTLELALIINMDR